ncbi:4'-phosphopantetheinyl transferase family protein [Phyllobacterium zundukense]|jgi:4'-phosphopantetheinyl transferase|uniref:4'-phosphopantetheinyl transferase superfamily protein n=1 Tax=Phyllobacterium zundukense TaxID=1867719 RepID=A0ACD4CUA3_9HYPH|nr:4'-phosphopantetheinyl transferase superfamily protein [Phyllobacterium zundukense]UXN57149.1 4'-phosphopantetheinyl transferase superfamily protein [Phyllobacterium zundukense]
MMTLPCDPLPDLPGVRIDQMESGVDIWWWAYSLDTDWSRIRFALVPDERARATDFHFEKDAWAFMAGRYLQRSVLSFYTGLPMADLNIVSGLHGKPALAGQSDGIAFNLSNTEGFAAFAISRDAVALGIDVEALTTVIEPETASLFCSVAESEMLSVLRGPARQSRLLSYWTLKESYLKATGTGLTAAPEQLNIRLDRGTNAILMDKTPSGDDALWHHRLFLAPSGHLIAVSAQSQREELLFRQRELD